MSDEFSGSPRACVHELASLFQLLALLRSVLAYCNNS